jgi:hypothetical protein
MEKIRILLIAEESTKWAETLTTMMAKGHLNFTISNHIEEYLENYKQFQIVLTDNLPIHYPHKCPYRYVGPTTARLEYDINIPWWFIFQRKEIETKKFWHNFMTEIMTDFIRTNNGQMFFRNFLNTTR